MPSEKYHRDQAKVLAGLALSTKNALDSQRFTEAAVQHLKNAESAQDETRPSSSHPSAEG